MSTPDEDTQFANDDDDDEEDGVPGNLDCGHTFILYDIKMVIYSHYPGT